MDLHPTDAYTAFLSPHSTMESKGQQPNANLQLAAHERCKEE